MILGGVMGYLTYEVEPWETVGGGLFGLGFGLFLFSFAIEKKNN